MVQPANGLLSALRSPHCDSDVESESAWAACALVMALSFESESAWAALTLAIGELPVPCAAPC